MTPSDPSLNLCQKAIGYQFNDLELLRKAMTHASAADERLVSNERLEFLGDAILGMVICHELFERFPNYLEGELTKIKSMIVSRRTCAKVTQKIGLSEFLCVGKGMVNNRKLPSSCCAAVLESIIGAIFLDGGNQAAKLFILRQFGYLLDIADAKHSQDNYKSMLQQYAQQNMNSTPVYEMLDEKGPDHSKCFEVGVVIGKQRFSNAWGASKKDAEQLAAFYTLQELNVISSKTKPPHYAGHAD